MRKVLTKLVLPTLLLTVLTGVSHINSETEVVSVSAKGADDYWSTVDSKANADTLFTKISALIDVPKLSGGYGGLWTAYKTSDVVPGKQLIWDMYGGFQFSTSKQGLSYKKEGDGYNREHSIPKSWWGSTEDERYCDLMYLVPTDGYVNNRRSNYAFGEVSNVSYSYSFSAKTDGYGNTVQTAGVSKLGSGKSINGISAPGTVFEPDDQYKGDFARMYYYYATRYGRKSKMATQDDGAYMFNSNSTDFYMTAYGKALMNKWHVMDPVSQKELDRNDAVEDIQGNRNPYIDHPEWADKIYGSNYEETNGQIDDTPSMTISASSTSIKVGDKVTITATKKNLSGTVNWYFEDFSTDVASLNTTSGDSITLTALKEGTVTLYGYVGSIYKSITFVVTSSGGSTSSSITATANRTFYVGDTISSSDITVKNSSGTTVSGFTFTNNGYQFTYEDAASGGALTNKTFANSITYSSQNCSLTVQVQRKAKTIDSESVGGTDILTAADFGATSNSYAESTATKNSGATYVVKTAKDSSGNIQMNNKNNVGIVTKVSGGTIKSVTINVGSGSNTINVYGKNSAYTSAADLYHSSSTVKGTLVGSVSNTGTVSFTTPYTYVGITSAKNAIYIKSIEITYVGSGTSSDTAINVANYIMYEDTVGQCASKFPVAKESFENLTSSERNIFMTSNDYVISKARERLIAWARSIGSSISLNNGEYIITAPKAVNSSFVSRNKGNIKPIIVGCSCVCVVLILIYLKRKFKIKIVK